MEAPDADGFVNISWPSKNVPHGGIFHTHIAKSSTEQQQFLKVLIEESRLDTKLRHCNVYGLRCEARSPSRASRASPASAASAPAPVSALMMRPRTSRRRSLSAIRQTGLLDVDTYRPVKKGEDREKLKDRLANTMANGDTTEQVVPLPMGSQLKKKTVEKKLPTEKQKWNELVTQIRERAEWLAEMEYLGEGGAHRDIINEQIAERMRALDALGIDSQCSTARSTITGFSTTRSKEKAPVASAVEKVASGRRSNTSQRSSIRDDKNQGAFRPTIKVPVVETVAAYNKLSPLGYSPRRRQ